MASGRAAGLIGLARHYSRESGERAINADVPKPPLPQRISEAAIDMPVTPRVGHPLSVAGKALGQSGITIPGPEDEIVLTLHPESRD